MTNAEFQEKLDKMYEEFPIIAMSKQKTINELVFILRQDNDVPDYCLNINSDSQGFIFGMLKESFFPVRHLALKIESLEYEECEDSEYPVLVAKTN
jgi:hypothetical protein